MLTVSFGPCNVLVRVFRSMEIANPDIVLDRQSLVCMLTLTHNRELQQILPCACPDLYGEAPDSYNKQKVLALGLSLS